MSKDEAPQENEQKVDLTWEGDFKPEDLEVPYSREDVKDEKKEESKEEENEEKGDQEPAPAPEVASIVTLEDPGDFTPEDLSFEYEIEGKKFTISKSDDIDAIPDEDLEKLSAAQITKLLRRANNIDSKLEQAEKDYQSKKEAYQKQVEEENEREEMITTFAAEFDYLVSKGLIPEVPENLRNADWSDPSVSSQEGVKEQKEILDYMEKENRVRMKAGLKPLSSILDAFNAFQMETGRAKSKEDKEAEGEARKAAGARVAAPTNNSASTPVPKGIAVGRVNALRNNVADWQ